MRISFLVVLLVVWAAAADAQPRVGVDVGVAVPTGALGEHRSAGVAASVSVGPRASGLTPRLDVALAHLPGDGTVSENGTNSRRGDYTSAGLRLSAVYRARGRGAVPYGLIGGGLYGLTIERDQNPYGDVFGGLHAGLGIDVPLDRVALMAEIGAVVMATDYGAGAFNFPTVHVPLTVGVRF